MKKLFTPNIANGAFWLMVVTLAWDIWLTYDGYANHKIAQYTGSGIEKLKSVGFAAIIIIAYVAVVMAAPSIGRWLWCGVICFIVTLATATTLRLPPPPRPYTLDLLLSSIVFAAFLIVPLVAYRLTAPDEK